MSEKLGQILVTWYPRHRISYVVIIGGLTILNMLQGAPWWALWPMLIWGVVFMVHLLIVKSITVDEQWVDERAFDLRSNSYDFGHMKDLEARIRERDFSVEPLSDDDSKRR